MRYGWLCAPSSCKPPEAPALPVRAGNAMRTRGWGREGETEKQVSVDFGYPGMDRKTDMARDGEYSFLELLRHCVCNRTGGRSKVGLSN